jgi:hypothetical protein
MAKVKAKVEQVKVEAGEGKAATEKVLPEPQQREEERPLPAAAQPARDDPNRRAAQRPEEVRIEEQDVEITAPPPQEKETEHQATTPGAVNQGSLEERILEALGQVDRLTREDLARKLGIAVTEEFRATVDQLYSHPEGRKVMEDLEDKTLYIPLTEEEKRQHAEKLKVAKRDDRFAALQWILEHRTYRGDYPNWDAFLVAELGKESGWWDSEVRQHRLQRLLDEQDLKLTLSKKVADQLNKLRDDPEAMVEAVAEFQKKPVGRQIVSEMKKIVEDIVNAKRDLAEFRKVIPDGTHAEFAALTDLGKVERRWKGWHEDAAQTFAAAVKDGADPREALVRMAKDRKALPPVKSLFAVARGPALEPLVQQLVRMAVDWERDRQRKADIEMWKQKGAELRIFNPDTNTVLEEAEAAEAVEAEEKPAPSQPTVSQSEQKEELEPEPIYDVQVTGDFRRWGRNLQRVHAESLVELLEDLAAEVSDKGITQESTLTVRPAVALRKEA